MKFGVFLNTQWPAGGDAAGLLTGLLEQVRVAREAGFEGIFAGQHFVSGDLQMFQPIPLLARLAAEGPGMTFGTCIVLLPMVKPVAVAEEAATLDVITGGKAVLGVGLGYRDEEFAALGVPKSERGARMADAVPLMRKLWSGQPVSYGGPHGRIDGASIGVRPLRPGGPPVWMGGQTPAAVRRAARLADAWMADPIQPLDKLRSLKAEYDAARHGAGLGAPQARPLIREVCVRETTAAAQAACEPTLWAKYQSYVAWGNADAGGDGPLTFESFSRDRFVIGDEAQVKNELVRFAEAFDADWMLLRPQWPGLAQAETLETLRALAPVIAAMG